MPDLPTPQATRLRPPSWRDTRLLVGVLLVIGSVVVGARVVSAADDTVPVYAAASTLAPGDPLRAADLAVVRLRLVGGTQAYLDARRELPAGLVALRTVGRGELLPAASVGPSESLRVKPLSVPLDAAAPAGLAKGARVDVWVARRDAAAGATAFAKPQQVVDSAEVASVTTTGGTLGGARSTTVQLLLAEGPLRELIDAMANQAKVTVVVLPGTATEGTP